MVYPYDDEDKNNNIQTSADQGAMQQYINNMQAGGQQSAGAGTSPVYDPVAGPAISSVVDATAWQPPLRGQDGYAGPSQAQVNQAIMTAAGPGTVTQGVDSNRAGPISDADAGMVPWGNSNVDAQGRPVNQWQTLQGVPGQQMMQQVPGMQQQGSPQGMPQGGAMGQALQGINPTPTGLPNQGNPAFGTAANGWVPPKGYFEGSTNHQLHPQLNPANMNGMQQRAYVEGQMQAQQLKNARDANGRANETQGWQRQEITKQQQIAQGMQQAAMQNGYGGVVDYLKTADPQRAIALQTQKTELDKSMLQSDSMKMLNDQQKKAALFQGYTQIGKMGATILSAPVEQRQALYQTMLPMVKAVVPHAPNDLVSATPMLVLAAGQASPDNALWAAKQDVMGVQSSIGKAQSDLNKFITNGGDPNSQYGQSLRSQINEASQTGMLKQAQVDELSTKKITNETDAKNKQLATIQSIAGSYQGTNEVKMYNTFDPFWQKFQAAQKALIANPKNSNAQEQLALAAAGMGGIKRISPAAAEFMASTGSDLDQYWEKLQSKANSTGTKVFMGPEEISRMMELGQQTHAQMAAKVNTVTNLYQKQAQQFSVPGGVSIQENIPWVNTGDPLAPAGSNIPSQQQIDQQAQQAIAKGAKPQAIEQQKQQYYQKYGYH